MGLLVGIMLAVYVAVHEPTSWPLSWFSLSRWSERCVGVLGAGFSPVRNMAQKPRGESLSASWANPPLSPAR